MKFGGSSEMAADQQILGSLWGPRGKSATDVRLTSALLILILLIGGAGVNFPTLQLLLNVSAAAAAAMFVITPTQRSAGPLDRWALLLAGCAFLLPLIQLVPLPPVLWHSLPGRDAPKLLDTALSWSIWRPWTLSVEGTVRSWLVMLPSVVLLWGCVRISVDQRLRLFWIIAAFALLNALLGILQLVTGGGATPYPSGHIGYPIGLFVNRNHSAAFMLAAIPIVSALGASRIAQKDRRSSILIATVSALTALAVVTIGTTSRMAIGLLPIALLLGALLLIGGKPRARVVLPTLAAVATVALVLFASARFQQSLGRFTVIDEQRLGFWRDTRWALEQYGFAGTGLGTFVPVYQSAASLEGLVAGLVNHAHNDYLEILLELGLPGACLVLAWVALAAVAVFRSTQPPTRKDRMLLRVAGVGGMVLLLVASSVDYPLRLPALAGTFVVLFASVLPGARREHKSRAGTEAPTPHSQPGLTAKRMTALVALVITLIVALQASMSARSLLSGDYLSAARWAPWSSSALEAVSTSELLHNDLPDAAAAATTAVRLSPISAPAIRSLGLAQLAEGKPSGNKLMEIAAGLGWRDGLTQLWAVDAAIRGHEPRKALQRAEALFRQNIYASPVLLLLLRAPEREKVLPALAQELGKNPRWRTSVIDAAIPLPLADRARFATLARLLSSSGAPMTRAETEALFGNWLERGQVAETRQLWSAMHGENFIDNGSFSAARHGVAASLPQDWDIAASNIGKVSIEPPQRGQRDFALRISDVRSQKVVSQELLLAPGTYQLNFRTLHREGSRRRVEWELRCKGSPITQQAGVEILPTPQWQKFSVSLTVPSRDCLIQALALRLPPVQTPGEFWIDDIELQAPPR